MIITPGTTYYAFASALDEIIVQNISSEEVTAKFTIVNQKGNTTTFSEKYAVVDNQITIPDVDEMLESYFDFDEDVRVQNLIADRGVKDYNPYVHLAILLSDDDENSTVNNTTTSFYVGYANVEMSADVPYKLFLSRSPYDNQLPQEGLGSVNFYHNEMKLKKDVVYLKDGVPTHVVTTYPKGETEYITGKEGNKYVNPVSLMPMQNYSFMWKDLLAEVQKSDSNAVMHDLRMVKFSLLNADDEVKDELVYYRSKNYRRKVKKIVFVGALGEVEILHLFGQTSRSGDLDATFITVDDDYKKVNTNLTISYEEHTGPLETWQRDLVYDMAESRWVYLMEDDELKPITITEVNLDEDEPHTSPIALTITYRIADKKGQREFARSSEARNDRVFTTDFTNVFS